MAPSIQGATCPVNTTAGNYIATDIFMASYLSDAKFIAGSRENNWLILNF
jgi:hypothetical protein